MNELPKKILIVGLGLMGGSYARALTAKGYEVYAITKEQSDIDFAKKEGIIVDGKTIVQPSFIEPFKLIVFALYPDVLVPWLEENMMYVNREAVLTDVTGVKCPIIPKVKKITDSWGNDFVFAHPMAGREKRGVEYANANIFNKANFIVVPVEGNAERNLNLIEELGRELGCPRIVRLSPKEHDEMIAYLSQLAHVIAVALMDAKDNTHLAEYTGDSFRDLTRIAQINEDMWTSLFLLNKEELLKQMDLFMKEMGTLRTAIEQEDAGLLKEKMRESTRRRGIFAKDEEKKA